MLRAAAHVVVLGVVALLVVPCPAAADEHDTEGPVPYVHPVGAPVIDPFRAPASPYGPGNRGLEYGTSPGDVVGAAAAGQVVFAGDVAGSRHVTVRHADGRRTSYSFLREVDVRAGEHLGIGERVGVAGGPVHVGLREDGEYLDPARFFGVEVTSVRLVPENAAGGPLWQQAAREALHLAALARLEGGDGITGALAGVGGALLDGAGAVLPDAGRLLSTLAPVLVAGAPTAMAGRALSIVVPVLRGDASPLLHFLAEVSPLTVAARIARRTGDWWEQRSNCTPGDVTPAPPEGRRVAVLVAGLDSTSERAAIGDVPTEELGYEPSDVLGFSYRGGRTPSPLDGVPASVAAELSELTVRSYDDEDSTTDLARRGELLADLLVEVAASDAGTSIDLYAHSQGGLVVRLALADLAARPGGSAVLESLGLVATMGSPHQGTDLATLALLVAGTDGGAAGLAAVDALLGPSVDPRSASNIGDLAVGSGLVERLDDAGLPEGPRYLSLAARGDPVVLAERTRLEGATNVVLPVDGFGAHGDLPGHESAARELALALAGRAPTCESLLDLGLDLLGSEGVHLTTTALGAGAATVSLASAWATPPGAPLVR